MNESHLRAEGDSVAEFVEGDVFVDVVHEAGSVRGGPVAGEELVLHGHNLVLVVLDRDNLVRLHLRIRAHDRKSRPLHPKTRLERRHDINFSTKELLL